MRILLLYPPIDHQAVYSKDFRRVKGADTSAYPPLGLMHIQAVLKRETSHQTKLVDLTLPKARELDLDALLKDFRPDVVGMTAYTLCFYDALALAKRVKGVLPGAKVVMGGPHLSLYPRETMEHPEVDFAVVGDGEIPFLELVRALERGDEEPYGVPSLYYRDARDVVRATPAAPSVMELDELPFPCRDDLEAEGYFNPFFTDLNFATIATSRGCPFQCTFCDVTDKVFRSRSIGNIVDEIEQLSSERGVKNFFLVDDLFNITARRVEEFCGEITRRKLTIKWIFRGRIDQITERMLDVCKATGCIHIIFGVEDHTDEGLGLIRKKITTARAVEVFKQVRGRGIKATANFIVGFPHHKRLQDVMGLSDFLATLRPDFLQIGILIPFPGSQIFREAVSKGVVDPERWRGYVLNPTPVFEMPLWLEHLSLEELTECYERILKSFYLSPRQLLARLMEIRSPSQLMMYAKVGLSTLRTGRLKPTGATHPEVLVPSTLARDSYYESLGLYRRLSGKTVLDVGCGTGFFSGRFAGHGARVYALDVSEGNARLAGKLLYERGARPLCGDSHALPLQEASVDAVFCSCVVEHFSDPKSFFKEVHRILKPGGEFHLTVDIRPRATFWLYRLGFFFDRLYDPHHPMLHKATALSDDACTEFISLDKLRGELSGLFEGGEGESFCGLNFNLVHGGLVIINKLYQIALGGIRESEDYAAQMRIMDRPLFRFYSKLLPVISILAHPRVLTFDAIYHYQALRKA